MLDYRISFESPWYLLLLGVIPLLAWWARGSLAGLGRLRAWSAMTIRGGLIALVVLALAGIQLVRVNDGVSVLYLVDRSLSMPPDKTSAVIDYINRSAKVHRDGRRHDRAGVIVFGRDAAVEAPPFAGALNLPARFESTVDREATDLAAALRLAQAVFPPDAAKRVVIITDGNQNAGDAFAQAQSLAEHGVGIDVVPIARSGDAEVAIEKLVVPGDARQGTPFDARVVLNTTGTNGTEPLRGRLRVSRAGGHGTEMLADQDVELPAGKHVLSFREELRVPDFYTYSARFVPEGNTGDVQAENNEATAFTLVRGPGQVLLIEDWTKPGQFDGLAEFLRRQDIAVTVQPSNQLFANLTELQRYDLVILANVARTSGETADQLTTIDDAHIEMLVRNTQHLGGGLIMLGGPESFGAGGWTNTPLEAAMPVDFQVKNAKVIPSGALSIVIDSSGSMTGPKLEMSKAAAIAAVQVLNPSDYVSVVAFDSAAHWIVPTQKIDSPIKIARSISRLGPGGGTNMRPGMVEGYKALDRVDAAIKHMIVLTDGQTEGSDYTNLASEARKRKITTTCVAVGQDSAIQLLTAVARAGGGKYYFVDNPRTIPRIFMKEAMRVARPVIFEDASGLTAQRTSDHEILHGIGDSLPPFTGYVMTTPKENPLVEIPLLAPKPAGHKNALLASWQFGVGRTVAFTTDAGQRWTKNWPQWPGYERLFTQMVRWAMRPTDDRETLQIYTEHRDGQVYVTVTALDKNDEFLNFLDLSGTVLGPQAQPLELSLKQIAPGRYAGQFAAPQAGSYFLSIGSGPGRPLTRAGINVPYSSEFKQQESNDALVRNLAALTPEGGQSGLVIDEPESAGHVEKSLRANVFRHELERATSRQDAWHLLVFAAACVLVLDVFNRRVLIGFGWLWWLTAQLRQLVARRPASQGDVGASLARLQQRKQQLDVELDTRRAGVRFEASATDAEAPELEHQLVASAEPNAKRPAATLDLAPKEQQDDYTARLLKAKQRARQQRRAAELNQE